MQWISNGALLTLFLSLNFVGTGIILAQQNPKAARTNAVMSMDAYKTDRALYKELKKAQENIDYAAITAPTNAEPKTFRYQGEIYTLIAFEERLKKDYPTAALASYEAWIKGVELEESKLASKNKPASKIPAKAEYKEGLENVGNALYNGGIDAINGGGYEKGYPFFTAIVNIQKKNATVFADKPLSFQFKQGDAERMAGLCALKAGKMSEGESILNAQIAKNEIPLEQLPAIYNMLAEAYIANKQGEKARNILADARKKFPTDKDLLYTEINLALAEGRLSELETQLKQAIESEPTNAELWYILGNMYDGLFRERLQVNDQNASVTAENEKSGLGYFQKAEDNYQKAVKLNGKHYNSLYGVGVLYVNYYNYCTKKLAPMSPKDATYATWSKTQEEAVNKSLEFLSTAEKTEPNNLLALEALKKIYGLKSNTAKFNEYKEKIAKAGGK